MVPILASLGIGKALLASELAEPKPSKKHAETEVCSKRFIGLLSQPNSLLGASENHSL